VVDYEFTRICKVKCVAGAWDIRTPHLLSTLVFEVGLSLPIDGSYQSKTCTDILIGSLVGTEIVVYIFFFF